MNPRDFQGLAGLKAIVPAFELFTVVFTFAGPFLAPAAWLSFVALFMAVFVLASALQVRRMATFVVRLRRALAEEARAGGERAPLVGGALPASAPPPPPSSAAAAPAASDAVALEVAPPAGFAHAFVIPNYNEPLPVLRSTLRALAAHPGARARYLVTLAMEAAEPDAPAKASALAAEWGGAFRDLAWTLHERKEGEAAGKAANVDHAARAAVKRAHALGMPPAGLLVTTMDADAHVPPQYVAGVDAAAAAADDPHATLYAAPIVFERNTYDVPVLTRVHDAMWSTMAAQNLGSSWGIGFPISNYTVPARLLAAVDYWDTCDDAIGEDLHMFLKCYFKSGGRTRLATVPAPINMLNLQADGYGATILARAVQAERHARGVADVAYSIRQIRLASPPLPRLPTAVLMLKLLEAQALPATAPFYMGIAAGWAMLVARAGLVAPYPPAALTALSAVTWLGGAGAAGFVALAGLNEAMRRSVRPKLYGMANPPLWRVAEYPVLAVGMWIFMVLPSLWAAAKCGLAGVGVRAGEYVVAEKVVAADAHHHHHRAGPPPSPKPAAAARRGDVELGVKPPKPPPAAPAAVPTWAVGVVP